MTARKQPTVRRFTVAGSGAFPVDMLRYDRAWPATQTDSSAVTRWGSVTGDLRDVTLETYGEPTTDRWASFGWRVKLAD